ncbi:MAG: tRNA (N6-isopentenyl adenosine(37)-C2)-methylthiotransferase MiaB [Myxococcaceae bacterium]
MQRYFIHTFGCQMNVSDTQRMGEVLAKIGYGSTDTADEADLIILNSCAIREKAEDKMLSALGRYRALKQTRGTLIGVGGCVAQQEKDKLLKHVPYLDFVFGPDAIAKLPDILSRVQHEHVRVTETAWMDAQEYVFPTADAAGARGKATEFITIMKGCDNVCSFCVVPHTRGREVSRPFTEVLLEVKALAEVGVREVTLLGQNVNSYRGGVSFAELLLRVAEVPNIARVRFTTSHPHDLSDELIAAFAQQPRIAPHFHLPVQSGADRVLGLMRRDYTVAAYLERLGRLRAARPGIAVTTDIIVGFPSETDEEFEQTMELTRQARFENQFSFLFSPRPRTAAGIHEAKWGAVSQEVKMSRLERLQALQRSICADTMQRQVGTAVEVLVEGPSRSDPHRCFGRTAENRTVNFAGDAAVGQLVPVSIRSASPNALFGEQA